MNFCMKSDLGRRRSVNQDTCAAKLLRSDLFLGIVCDGMGGSVGGEIASRIATDAFMRYAEKKLLSLSALPPRTVITLLSRAVDYANAEVHSLSQKNPSLSGMGTTLVAALWNGGRLYCANVGDSRMYYMSEHGILQCSHDHSYVQYLVDIGKLTPEEARHSLNRNIIMRAIGTGPNVSADVILTDIRPESGGMILLCSDGLTNHVCDSDLYEIVTRTDASLQGKTDMLIARANNAGGSDNITAVLAQIP